MNVDKMIISQTSYHSAWCFCNYITNHIAKVVGCMQPMGHILHITVLQCWDDMV